MSGQTQPSKIGPDHALGEQCDDGAPFICSGGRQLGCVTNVLIRTLNCVTFAHIDQIRTLLTVCHFKQCQSQVDDRGKKFKVFTHEEQIQVA